MPKRIADTQLTQDNAQQYLDEEDSEEIGTFLRADESVMKTRIIKSAVRKKPEGSTSAGKGLFSGINLTSSTAVSSSLGLPQTSSLLSGQKPPVFGAGTGPTSQPPANPLLRTTLGVSSTTPLVGVAGSDPSKGSQSAPDKSLYLTNLKSLNTSVLEWIQKHIKENPYVDLTPVFKDYQKHIQGIEEKFGSESTASEGESQVTDSECSQTTELSAASQSQTSEISGTPQTQTSAALSISLLQKPVGDNVQTSSQSIPVVSTTSNGDQQTGSNVDEDAPPVVPKSEPGPGETRAKLFYKKGDEYVTLGVGLLKVEKKDKKAWLLMRSDNVTKKTLLSVYVSPTTPLQQTEKNILFVVPPFPPLNPKEPDDKTPVTYVLRVKTPESATVLCASIKDAYA